MIYFFLLNLYTRNEGAVMRLYTCSPTRIPIQHIMLTGFSKIIEERIRKAQKKGVFENLEGAGKPLKLEEDSHIAEDLRLAHKILKNANCLPPEIELKKEIQRTEDLLSGMQDTAQKHRTLKKLNYLIMKLNMARNTSIELEMPQHYSFKLVDRLESTTTRKAGGLDFPAPGGRGKTKAR